MYSVLQRSCQKFRRGGDAGLITMPSREKLHFVPLVRQKHSNFIQYACCWFLVLFVTVIYNNTIFCVSCQTKDMLSLNSVETSIKFTIDNNLLSIISCRSEARDVNTRVSDCCYNTPLRQQLTYIVEHVQRQNCSDTNHCFHKRWKFYDNMLFLILGSG